MKKLTSIGLSFALLLSSNISKAGEAVTAAAPAPAVKPEVIHGTVEISSIFVSSDKDGILSFSSAELISNYSKLILRDVPQANAMQARVDERGLALTRAQATAPVMKSLYMANEIVQRNLNAKMYGLPVFRGDGAKLRAEAYALGRYAGRSAGGAVISGPVRLVLASEYSRAYSDDLAPNGVIAPAGVKFCMVGLAQRTYFKFQASDATPAVLNLPKIASTKFYFAGGAGIGSKVFAPARSLSIGLPGAEVPPRELAIFRAQCERMKKYYLK